MKYKLFAGAMAVVMLFCALAASAMEAEVGPYRVHQHQTARQPDAGCGCGGTELCTHLPLVVIDTGGEPIPGVPLNESSSDADAGFTTTAEGDAMLSARISILDDETRNHHPSDQPDLETDTLIRVRGNSSRYFDKKSYLLRFTDEKGEYADHEVMGMDAHYEWALYGPYLDKSLIRNYMWYNIAGEIMEWAPNVRYCELILDGEYRGLYLMVETITDGDGCRLDLRDDAYGTSVTGSLLRGDRTTEDDLDGIRDIYSYLERTLSLRSDIAIRYPKRAALTEEVRERIELDYAAFEKALYSYDHDTEDYGYWNYIDEDNFVDYFLINEYSLNMDAGRYSTYIYKDMTGKYKLAVWDFNNACDNFPTDPVSPDQLEMVSHTWYFMLCKSEPFVERILDRYAQLRETVFSDDYLMTYIDETLAYLGPALDRNNERWAQAMAEYEPLSPTERNLYSHEDAVEQLKQWLLERGEWLDENLHTIQQYCHPSRNKTYNH